MLLAVGPNSRSGEAAGEVRVAPRANDQALVLAGAFGAAALAHALVVLERGRQEDVVPAADVQRRSTDLFEFPAQARLDAQYASAVGWASQSLYQGVYSFSIG